MSEDRAANVHRAWKVWADACAKGSDRSCELLRGQTLLELSAVRAALELGCAAEPPSGSACVEVAKMAESGYGGARDHALAVRAAGKACDMKLAAGCLLFATTGGKESKGNAPASALTASKVTVDGTTFPSVECSLADGSPFAILTIAKGISSQRRALDACVKKATETPVEVTSAGGKFTSVRASGPDTAINKCVERAIAGKTAGLAGTCKLVIAHGR